MDNKLLGLKIKQLRSEHSLKIGKKFYQKDLADALGISRGYIGDIESGRTKPNDELLDKIANVFNVHSSVLDDNASLEGEYYGEHKIMHDECLKENPKLPDTDNKLLENFHKLNESGKKKLLEYSNDLVETPKYIAIKNNVTELIADTKTKEYTFAAHNDGLDKETAKRTLEKAKAIFKQMDEEEES